MAITLGIFCALLILVVGRDGAGGKARSDAQVDGLVLLQKEVRMTPASWAAPSSASWESEFLRVQKAAVDALEAEDVEDKDAESTANADDDLSRRGKGRRKGKYRQHLTKPEDVSSQRGIILRYMKSRDVAICACAKCGSTSLWTWLFENEFRHSFHSDIHRTDRSISVQDVEKDPWHGKVDVVEDKASQDEIMQKAFTFALVRDPKERLVSSWKSKVACGDRDDYGTDVGGRETLVRNLKELWGRDDEQLGRKKHKDCLKLKDFVRIILDIYHDGQAHNLNGHFMPQDKACFAHQPPTKWSQVSDIAGSSPFAPLARQLAFSETAEHSHSSINAVLISKDVDEMLNEITAPEYAILSPYLSRPSHVRPGAEVLLQTAAGVLDLRDE